MSPMTYHRPTTLGQAKELSQTLENAVFMSGGHTLLPAMKQDLATPDHVIDLSHIGELDAIRVDSNDLIIGAMSTHVQVATSKIVQKLIPALAGLAGSIGDRQVRQRGTIGGSVANNDPAADYPSAVLGLGGTIITNLREIRADDFFVGLFETALEPYEIIIAIRFPIPLSAGYAKFKSPAARYPQAGVFIARFEGSVRVAVTGAGQSGVYRLVQLEKNLLESFVDDAAANLEISTENLIEDMYATKDYRANLVKTMTHHALTHMGTISIFK